MEKSSKIILKEFLDKKLQIILQEIYTKRFSIVSLDSVKISIKKQNGLIAEYNVFDTNKYDVDDFLKRYGLTMEKSKAKPYRYFIQKK